VPAPQPTLTGPFSVQPFLAKRGFRFFHRSS
jgi:hypothetical protein